MEKPLPKPPSHIHPVRRSLSSLSYRRNQTTWQRCNGYRFGVLCCAWTCASVLFINVVVTIWAAQKFGLQGGLGIVQQGSCSKTKTLAFWVHLIINGLSSALLGASNYSMQCLSSPTRFDIDKAHRENTWMDVGIASVRNLSKIPGSRVALWWLLALSSIPLHLLFNSAIFSTLFARNYDVTIVTNDFIAAASLNLTAQNSFDSQIPFQDIRYKSSSIERLAPSACLEAYAVSFVSDRTQVVLVTTQNSTDGNFVLKNMTITSDFNSGWNGAYDWICPTDPNQSQGACDLKVAARNVSSYLFHEWNIQYCLSQRVEENCMLQFSPTIMIIVIICNLIKMTVMIWIAWQQNWEPLITLGDAIASFLDNPDPMTKDNCLAGRKRFEDPGDPRLIVHDDERPITAPEQIWSGGTGDEEDSDEIDWDGRPTRWAPRRQPWFRSAAPGRWILCNVVSGLTVILVGILLNLGLQNISLYNTSLSYLWSLGFGTVTSQELITALSFPGSNGLIVTVLIANSPQILLSFIYLTYNGLFTCMTLSKEWVNFAHERKTLRVTSPKGGQRSSYWLQLPYRYGIPLILTSVTLHWLVSQSIFLARVNLLNADGTPDHTGDISLLGYSNIAIVFVIALGSTVIIAGLAFGFRKYDSGMPLAGSCSAAISAACHPPKDDVRASLKPLLWGCVDERISEFGHEAVGHCSFTSLKVEPPVEGRLYT